MENIVIGIYGMRGSGKTIMLVLLLYVEFLAGKKILSNMSKLSFPSDIIIPEDLIMLSKKLEGCTMGIDELHTLTDSRKAMKKQNIQIANFVLQSRHRGVNIIYTEQFQGQAEKRIRDNTDIKIIAKNLMIDTDNDGFCDLFEYTVIDLRTEDVKTIQIYGKPIFDLYKDSEIIDIYNYEEEKQMMRNIKKGAIK